MERAPRKTAQKKEPAPIIDPTGRWSREVYKMTTRLGYPDGFLWHWYEQLTLLAIHEARIDMRNAEQMGFRLLGSMFDKSGQVPD